MVLEIKKLDINGNGIAYFKRKVVFVKGALPGEVVEAEITAEEKNFYRAEIVKIQKKSPKRVVPRCKIYKQCGGCNIMHLNYNEQLAYKRNTLIDTFVKYLGYRPKVNQTIGMTVPYNYRNKAQLHVKRGKEFLMGLFKEHTNFVIDIMDCDVQDKKLNAFLKKLKKVLEKTKVEISKKSLNRVMVRTNGEEFQVVLVSPKKLNYGSLVDDIKNIGNVDVFESIAKSHLFFEATNKLFGKERLLKKIGDKSYYVRPRDFFQLNDEQTKVLYDLLKKLVGDEKSIVDCYAGVGTISQYIASHQDVRGIEIVATAVESAKDNARVNKVKATYKKGSVGTVFKNWAKEGYRPETVIFDPPRIGLDEESIVTLTKIKPKKIIYVSCNPSTLAKDISLLDKYYRITYVQPIDMFPQTSNIETVVVLEKK